MDDLLEAGGRHRFASDAVDLVEGVRLEDALVRRADEDLKAERLLASVAVQLKARKTEERAFRQPLAFLNVPDLEWRRSATDCTRVKRIHFRVGLGGSAAQQR